ACSAAAIPEARRSPSASARLTATPAFARSSASGSTRWPPGTRSPTTCRSTPKAGPRRRSRSRAARAGKDHREEGLVSILKFLGFGEAGGGPGAAPTAESESVREIIRTLDRLEPDRARFLAAFAYILGRVARADLVISEAE